MLHTSTLNAIMICFCHFTWGPEKEYPCKVNYTGQQINRAIRYLGIRFSQKLKNLQLSKLYLQKVRFMVIKMKGNSLGLINISVFIKDFTKKSRFPVVTIVSNDKVKKKN